MKTAQEFRIEVYEKRNSKLMARKKTKKRALLCVPLALVVLVCGVASSGFLKNARVRLRIRNKAIPLCLPVVEPAPLPDKNYSDYNMELMALYERSGSEEDLAAEKEELEKEAENARESWEGNALSPEFSQAVNDFARDTASLLDLGENGCFAPISLYYSLALAGSGAQGETEQEFLDVLNAPDKAWLADQCGKYYRQHYHDSDYGKFLIANSLWLDGSCTFSDGFLSTAQNDFYSSLFQADFTNPALGARVGDWISQSTNGLLSPDYQFDPDTMLALINTVYLNESWGGGFFDEGNTESAFTKADGSAVTAEYMNCRNISGAYIGENFTSASLPLQNAKVVFVLPDEGVTPQELLQDPEAFENMFYPKGWEEYENCEILWSVPKFSFDAEYDLENTLKSMGLSSAFESDKADFSGIGTSPWGGLYLSAANHGVHVSLDEKGVESAAHTDVMMTDQSSEPGKTVEMKLDRPFLFAILGEDRTEAEGPSSSAGSLLFVGVCGDPTAE